MWLHFQPAVHLDLNWLEYFSLLVTLQEWCSLWAGLSKLFKASGAKDKQSS